MTRIVPTVVNFLTALRTQIYDFSEALPHVISVTIRSSARRHAVTHTRWLASSDSTNPHDRFGRPTTWPCRKPFIRSCSQQLRL